jgi:hypothetical protein
MCGMDDSNVKRNQLIGLEVLQKTYEHLGVALKRNLLTIEEFNELLSNVEDLIIDSVVWNNTPLFENHHLHMN